MAGILQIESKPVIGSSQNLNPRVGGGLNGALTQSLL